MECIFCKIVNGEIASDKVFEDEEVLAFRDIHPIAPVHVLVVPKKHIKQLADANKSDQMLLGKLQLTAAQVANEAGIKNAFKVMVSNGEKAGQSVFHLHYHVIGGWKNGSPKMESEQAERGDV